MKQHVRILSAVLVILVSLSLAGCGSLPSNDQRGPQGPVGPQNGVGPQRATGAQGLDGMISENVTVIEDSGRVVRRAYDFAGFEKVEVSDGFDVEITQGDTFSVVLHIEENLEEHVHVTQADETLRIGLNPSKTYHMVNITARAEVTMLTLSSLVLDLSGDITLQEFETTAPLAIVMSLSSSLRGEIEAGDLSLDIGMSGDVSLSGSAQNVTVVASGGSDVNLANLAVVDADVHAHEGSTVTVNPSGSLDAYASTNAYIFYLGSPLLGTIHTSSGGTIQQG